MAGVRSLASADKLVASCTQSLAIPYYLGEKVLRKDDHQAFNREFIFEMKDGKYKILEVVPKERTMLPPACRFA
jgi:hypothetical protein